MQDIMFKVPALVTRVRTYERGRYVLITWYRKSKDGGRMIISVGCMFMSVALSHCRSASTWVF